MTVKELSERLQTKMVLCPDLDREVEGVYTGDLLSWVMGNASSGQALVTIMSNINVVAVASLLDLSVVILSEGVTPDQDMMDAAKAKSVNLLVCEGTSYDVCVAISRILL